MDEAGVSPRARDTARLLWRVVTRFWSARALAEAGVEVSGPVAVVAGQVTIGLIGALALHALGWEINEPYPDFWAAVPPPRLFYRGFPICAAVLGGALLIAAGVLALPSRGVSWARTHKAIACALLLLPLGSMIPFLCWLPFGVLRNIGEPSLEIGLAKPAWAAWDIWPVAGSFYVFFALVGWSVVRLALAIPIVRELTRDPSGCAACGYPLAGIPSGVCPECGRRRESTPALPAKRTEAGP